MSSSTQFPISLRSVAILAHVRPRFKGNSRLGRSAEQVGPHTPKKKKPAPFFFFFLPRLSGGTGKTACLYSDLERRHIANGQPGPKDQMVGRNFAFSSSIWQALSGEGLICFDLIQEGTIRPCAGPFENMIHRGHRFSTYAFGWIRQGLNRPSPPRAEPSGFPVNGETEAHAAAGGQGPSFGLQAETAPPPVHDQLAAKLTLPLDPARRSTGPANCVRSPSACRGGKRQGRPSELLECCPQHHQPSPLEQAESQ